MKVAIVVFLMGEQYINSFNIYFRKNLENYCSKYGYDLILQTELIQQEKDMTKKKFYWQRMLVPNRFRDYDFVLSLDSDIFVSDNSPELPLKDIPEGKIGAVNERKYFGNYEWRENIQLKNKWEKTGQQWYALSGENKNYNDHINGGFVIYQPKYHADMLLKLYNENINNYMKYHQDDQSILSSFFIDNNLIFWLDERFNRVWFFWKEIFYPNFYSLSVNDRICYVRNFISLNYFTHFTSGTDIQYIYTGEDLK
jgi:hypothetical protein